MQEILQFSLFQLGGKDFSIGQLILGILVIVILWFIYRTILKTYFPKVFQSTEISETDKKKLGRLFRGLAIACLILILLNVLGLDFNLVQYNDFSLGIITIVKALVFFQIARLLDWLFSTLFINSYYRKRSEDITQHRGDADTESSARSIIHKIFYIAIGIYFLQNFNGDLTLFQKTINGEIVSIKISNLLYAILILLIARLLVWGITQIFLFGIYNNKNVAVGSRYAINQLVKYVIYVFAIISALGVFGINMGILLGGAAALLVGIGLGLQQTFNDFISGIVLLFERSVSVGDVLQVDGEVGRVKEIGLRSSTLQTPDNIRLVVPNHKLVNDKVINWNHNSETVRFNIPIGVAYGSDTASVKKSLLSAVRDNPYVLDYPAAFVRFVNFGDSSLDFQLYFFSKNLMVIEDIKSDIRFEIDKLFRKDEISIPFPQRVIRIVSEDNPSVMESIKDSAKGKQAGDKDRPTS